MKKYLSSVVAAALLSSFVVGCSDSNDDDSTEAKPYTAAFAATPAGETSGVSYVCGDVKGTIKAGSKGLYGPCEQDEIAIFSLGNVELGQVAYSTVKANGGVVKASDLTAVTKAAGDDLASKNLALLYSLDGDANPDNGVGVEEDAIEELNKQFPVGTNLATVPSTTLDSATATVAATIPTLQVVTTDEAAVHVEELEQAEIPAPPGVVVPEEPNVTGAAS